jgi:hypothetical protein
LPEFNCFLGRKLSPAASNLVRFDAESIQQVVSAERGGHPNLWVIDPAQYEKNGRVLRDSDSPRMLAYSSADQMLYATDGCNSCARRVPAGLKKLSAAELKSFAEENELRLELLEYLVSLL